MPDRTNPVRLPAWRTVVYEVALNGWRILRETVNDFSLWRIIEYPWATRALELQRGDLVLDVGSGTSSFPHMLAKEGVDVVVLELDAERVRWQLAKRRETAHPGDGRFFPLVASATQMPLRDGSVARIAAVSSLEHIPDDAAAGREIGRVLAHGGIAALTLPYTSSERREFFAGIRRFVQVELNAFVQEGKPGSFFRFYTDEDLQRVYVRPWQLAMGGVCGFGRSFLNWRYHETRLTRYWRRFVLKDLLLALIVHPLEERFDRSDPLYVMFTLRKR
ncbi:MAG: class I SAM-dependent methyltransferase [Candidatus Viridilinea halotolerans]|uniref:Class I SAM-dependent methyltransferase n=1 Tax=Candidatus Viridilinea halotolerans TaxID=2491704 RepID=A0A426TUY9_9CHLR|nr:MAG: class I SAM-dependent methyltransferase [Candidatus Viridilinea halotolerans]